MPGKLRKRHRWDQGLHAESPEHSSLPLVEAAAVEAGLPGALRMQQELMLAGYFEETLLGQWNLVHSLLRDHALEATDSLLCVQRLAEYPDPRARFFAP